MSKRDYEIIVVALRKAMGGSYAEYVDSFVKELSKDNKKFNKSKFYEACSAEENY